MSLIFVLLFHLALAHIEKPIITDLNQIDQDTILIKWIYKNLNSHRLRVQFSNDDFHYDINEWPVNFEEANETNGEIIDSISVKSNFECILQCIKIFDCKHLIYKYDDTNNCFLKKKSGNESILKWENEENYEISDTNKEILIKKFPYNDLYKFRIMVYDEIDKKWSLFSDSSRQILDTRINLFIIAERVGNNSLRIEWKQLGSFSKYPISRYNIQTSVNEEPFEDNFDLKFLSSELLYQNFFEPPLPPSIGTCTSEKECFIECSKNHDCIKYAFNITHGNCHLINRFDPFNAIKTPTIISKTITSSSNQFILENLQLFSKYKIKINFKNHHGIQGSSNLISYVLTKLKPFLRIKAENNEFTVLLNWTIVEPVKLRTYMIHSSINGSSYFDQYFESNLNDYDDPKQQIFYLNLNDCFYKCAMNYSCLAFTWNRFENKCFLKSNKTKLRPCDSNFFCSSIMEYNNIIQIKNHFVNTKYCYMISVLSYFGLVGEKSNKVCFKWNVTVTLNSDKEFKEGSRATLYCNVSGISIDQLEHLKWIKNSKIISDAYLSQTHLHHDRLNLELYSLNYTKDNGIYYCEITLKNSQILVSNKLDIKVVFSPQVNLNMKSKYLTLTQGDRINVSCYSSGYPVPDIKFIKNGKNIKSSMEIYDYKNFHKTIYLNIEKSSFHLDNGTYSCYLNKFLAKSFDIFIKYGPLFGSESSQIHVKESDNVSIECSISKHPRPRIVWQRSQSNEQLSIQSKYSNETYETSTLKLENVTRNDMDEYSCFDSENSHLRKKYYLNVHFMSYLKDENKTEEYRLVQNSSIELYCFSIGFPISNIEWKFDTFNVDLNPSKVLNSSWNQTSVLILENLSKYDEGNYSCGFKNDNINFKKYFRIYVQSKPKSPNLVLVEEMKSGMIKIIWYVEDIGNSALVSAVLEWANSFEGSAIKSINFKFTETLVQENKNYEIKLKVAIPNKSFIRLSVENSVGRSEPSYPKYFERKQTINTPVSNRIKSKTIFVLIISLIVVFIIVGIFVAVLFKLSRDFKKKTQLNQESQCKLNDTIESRSLHQIESVSNNLNSESKMSERRKELSSPHTTRKALGPNFGIFSKFTSFKRRNPNQIKRQHFLESTINDINLIDKHINLPIALKDLTSQLDYMDDSYVTYTKESLLKRFTQDFETLDKDMHFEFCEIKNPINKSFHDSLKIQNERKSRYKHVYPYDDNRVKLSLVPGRPDSDFINASYIEGHNQSRRFIAAQGPTKDTTEDFLRMAVEKNVKVIVMLTKIYEGDPPILKCWPYWNDKNLIKFGLSSCEVKSIENKLFYEKRKLKIRYKDLQCSLDHYYYKEWPDRSSPLESQSIIELIESIVKNLDPSPILVHCSAGIGRTGTFIALYNLMDMMKDTSMICPNKTVYEIRRQRAYSVQNWEQYKFIHQTLLEWLMFSNCTISVADKDAIKSILSNKNGLENELSQILELKDTFKLKTYSYMNIIKCSSIQEILKKSIEYNPSNCTDSLENFKLLDFLFLKMPPFNLNFVFSTEPTNKNINLYLTAIFRLKPEIIVSLSPKENSYFSVLNETSIDKNLVCGIVVLCQEINSNDFFKEYDLELIDTKNKNKSIKIRYFTTQNLWSDEDLSNSKSNSATNFSESLFEQNEIKSNESDKDTEKDESECCRVFPVSSNESIIKLFEALNEYMQTKNDFLNSSSSGLSKSKSNIFLIQADKKLSDSIEKHGLFISLMYLYYNIKIKNDFNIVQIVRLLRKTYPRFLNKKEAYDYLYNFCSSNSLI